MVFCTEFLDGWWSWKPLRRSCVRCGWCREAKVFCIGLYFQLDEPSAVSLSSALLRSALRPTTHLPLPHTTEFDLHHQVQKQCNTPHFPVEWSSPQPCVQKILYLYPETNFWQVFRNFLHSPEKYADSASFKIISNALFTNHPTT